MLEMTHSNIVQSIRAFQPEALRNEAFKLGHHFLYADLSHARSRTQVFRCISRDFQLPQCHAKNHDSLRCCLTTLMHRSGPQNGFVVMLEHMPDAMKFGVEAREKLLDAFRDMADFWAEWDVPFRVFYSYAIDTFKNSDMWETGYRMKGNGRLLAGEARPAGMYKSLRKMPVKESKKPKLQPSEILQNMRSAFDTQFLHHAI